MQFPAVHALNTYGTFPTTLRRYFDSMPLSIHVTLQHRFVNLLHLPNFAEIHAIPPMAKCLYSGHLMHMPFKNLNASWLVYGKKLKNQSPYAPQVYEA